jgi:hypothetical protein
MKTLNIKGKCEAAFLAILKPYSATQELSGFQWVYRFFTGKLKEKRISIVSGTPIVKERQEDNTPYLWEVPITVEIVTGIKATTNTEHDELVATVAGAMFDGSTTCESLNNAMQGQEFKALAWMFGDGPDEDADDQLRKARLTGTLLMMPIQSA